MKASIFDMTFTLPPLVVMVEAEKDMPMGTVTWPGCSGCWTCNNGCQETAMKASIFNMTFTLPPMVEMTEVETGMARCMTKTGGWVDCWLDLC